MRSAKSVLVVSLCVLAPALLAQLDPPQPRPIIGVRSLALSPDGENLAFAYRGDVWVVPSQGGKAEPITNNVELNSGPAWSPDGQWIAFSTGRFGSTQTMLVPARGGSTQRLTWYPGGESPADWTPDGKSILTVTTREDTFPGFYLIDAKTTRARRLMSDHVGVGSPTFSPDGGKVAFTRLGFPWFRPRYQGSAASQLWVLDVGTGKRTELRNNGFQHLWPRFGSDGKTIFAVTVSDKTPSSSPMGHPIPKNVDSPERTPNVYAVDLGGKAKRLTSFVGGGVRFLAAATKAPVLAFEYEGEAYVLSPGGKPRKIEITATQDDKTVNEERLILTTGASSPTLSPDGKTFAFVVRDEVWTTPLTKGKGPNADDATQLTDWSGVDGNPLWAPDGKSVFFTSDRQGSERLYRLDLDTKQVSSVSKADFDVKDVELTPDKANVSYWLTGKLGGLFVVPVKGGEPKKVIDMPGSYLWGSDYSWSPDSKYVAYPKRIKDGPFNIWITDVAAGKAVKLTALNADHGAPGWSADGKYLYFRSNREGDGLYLIPLKQEDARIPDLELKFEKPSGPVKVEIDFQDIDTRVRKLTSQAASRNILSDPITGDIYYVSNDGDIWKTTYNGETTTKVSANAGISSFEFSSDKRSLVYEQNGNIFLHTFRSAPPRGGPEGGSGGEATGGPPKKAPEGSGEEMDDAQRRQRPPIAPSTAAAPTPTPQGVLEIKFRCDWTRDVMAEHKAAFYQFWRSYNRGFYDPNFHGRDWVAIRNRYEPLLDSVRHRSEMATVLNEMVGELESSHSEVGPAPGNPSAPEAAHLGLTFDYGYAGPGLKIQDVPARSPGSYPKTKLNAGEYIVAIDGKDVSLNEALYRDVLNKEAGRDLTLLVNAKPSREGAREVKYRALSGGSFRDILYQNRIEKRRKYVEAKSNGALTYIHISGMGGNNLQDFGRQFWELTQGKKGVVIDVRDNGGGNISDQLIDVLERVPHSYYQDRDWEPTLAPSESWDLPTVVMHAESSFSNAEMFPYAMKQRRLATLVGMPTPGYVIWTGGLRLVDGTSARMPGAGVFRLNGISLENNGVEPDIKVPITREQYFAGEDPQLDKAIEVLLKKIK